jgi:hypothetical protein
MHSPGASPCPTSLAAKRLDLFVGEIQKNTALLLIKQPPRPLLVTPTVDAAKHSSSRLANRKLAKIPIAHHGEILLMRRFAANGEATRDLNGVFNTKVTRGNVDVVLDMFPSLKKCPASVKRECSSSRCVKLTTLVVCLASNHICIFPIVSSCNSTQWGQRTSRQPHVV